MKTDPIRLPPLTPTPISLFHWPPHSDHHHPAAAMTSLHSSVGSKSTDPHLPCGNVGGESPRVGTTSSSSFGGSRGAGGGRGRGRRGMYDEGSSAAVIRSSWIARLRGPPPRPPPSPPQLPPLAAAAGSPHGGGAASTRESCTREQETEQESGRRSAAEEEEEDPGRRRRGRLVAGFGPFQVDTKRPRLSPGRSPKQSQEHARRRLEGHHGAPAVVGVPDKSSCQAYLLAGCFPIFQRMARIGEVCRGQQVAVKDRKEKEEWPVEGEGGIAFGPSGGELLSAAAAASSQAVGSGSAPRFRAQSWQWQGYMCFRRK